MDLKHPEVKFLAMRVYAQDLVLRAICQRLPEVAKAAELHVHAYRELSLAGDTPDAHREEIVRQALRIITGGPVPKAPDA